MIDPLSQAKYLRTHSEILWSSLKSRARVIARNVVINVPLLGRWLTAPELTRRISNSDRPELEQAAVRGGVSSIVLLYLFWYAFRDGHIQDSEGRVLVAAVGYFAFNVALIIRILSVGGVSIYRRFLGMVIDNGATTYCLVHMGEGGAVILGVYLFFAFGNGFRYGRFYLHVCQTMGVAGFTFVLFEGDYWSNNLSVGIGCLASLIVLPFYVGVLAQRITEAKQRADDANKAKGRFLANVSHEMRTPLNGVIAMADILRETKLSETQSEIVETLTSSSNLLLAQIEDVLDMAKIEAGRVHIEQRPFDLSKLVASTVKLVFRQARYKGLDVRTEISSHATGWFLGDAHHLRQVLLNLLANAIKFTEHGEVRVVVLAEVMAGSTTHIRIEVQDTGIGIPANKQAQIFEPFTQADDSITRVYGGTGLGTTIAQQLITLMGGQIGVQSTLGAGSTFWIELDLASTEPVGMDLTHTGSADLVPSGTADRTNIAKFRGARVLIAEDNPTNQRVTQMILESGDHRVTIVSNGEEALDQLERGNFDLALFDLSMPVVSGIEALKLYRFSTQDPIPVIILSANVTTDTIIECDRAGAAEFLSKPIRASILLDAIDRHLAGRSQHSLQSNRPVRSDERPALVLIDPSPVDPDVLEDLARIGNDPTFVERLLEGFMSDAARLRLNIAAALAARKYESVKDAAHALKGGAASVGATQLVHLATRLEKASFETLRIRSSQFIEELDAAIAKAVVALNNYLETRRLGSKAGTNSPSNLH